MSKGLWADRQQSERYVFGMREGKLQTLWQTVHAARDGQRDLLWAVPENPKPSGGSVRVIFLDIDGVLNSGQSVRMHHHFVEDRGLVDRHCPISVGNLEWILREVPDVQICICSVWRVGRTVPELQNLLTSEVREIDGKKHILRAGITEPNRVIGKTPDLAIVGGKWREGRGHEIQCWLNAQRVSGNPIEDFCIIDDSSDMFHLSGYLFHTDHAIGLDHHTAQRVISYFGASPLRRRLIRFGNYTTIMLRDRTWQARYFFRKLLHRLGL